MEREVLFCFVFLGKNGKIPHNPQIEKSIKTIFKIVFKYIPSVFRSYSNI